MEFCPKLGKYARKLSFALQAFEFQIKTVSMKEHFRKLAHTISEWVGSPLAFGISIMGILIWSILGPVFNYSDTWQLIINTTTTIITFLIVFLIQNTQNRDARAIHLKLDELIRSNADARNKLIDLENLSDAELDLLHEEFCRTQAQTELHIKKIEHHRKKHKAQRHSVPT